MTVSQSADNRLWRIILPGSVHLVIAILQHPYVPPSFLVAACLLWKTETPSVQVCDFHGDSNGRALDTVQVVLYAVGNEQRSCPLLRLWIFLVDLWPIRAEAEVAWLTDHCFILTWFVVWMSLICYQKKASVSFNTHGVVSFRITLSPFPTIHLASDEMAVFASLCFMQPRTRRWVFAAPCRIVVCLAVPYTCFHSLWHSLYHRTSMIK